ncbi:MAG: sulfatase-like hydrolase/transferase [Opitutales bacterium]
MKKTLTILSICLALTSLIAKDKRPNIIFFLTDDQTRNSTGMYGNEQVKTPNMDKLANDGVIFANSYATTTICMASRASIMTGMYEYKTGCNFDKGPLHKEKFELSYPVLLRKAGYYTGFAGKFGFAVTDSSVTDSSYHSWDVMPMDSFDWWAGTHGQSNYATKTNHENLAKYADEYPHSSRAYGAACSDFIKDAVKTGKEPFCLSMSFKAAHTPITPDPFFNNVYKGVVWKKSPNYGVENGTHLVMQSRLGRQYTPSMKAAGNPNLTKYHQLIHGADYAIGMILKTLEEQGIADNTIILFTSDNGYSCGAHGFGDKVLAYEEAAKTPLIIYDPRAKKADTVWRNAVAANIDIAPTILEYAGVEIPENMDGKSLVKVVNDPKERVRKALPLYQAWGCVTTISMAVVTENYKYIYWPFAENNLPEGHELFHLTQDKYEMQNVYDNPEYKPALDELKEYLAIELTKFKAENVGHSSYKELATLYDPEVSWDEKRKIIPDLFTTGYHSYPNLMKSRGYKGDIYDYEAVMAFLNKPKTKKTSAKKKE